MSAQMFGQHVGIAKELLSQFEKFPTRMSGATDESVLYGLQQEARTVWENLWDQLGQARTIAEKAGRDVSGYDAARRAAGDIWLNAAEVNIGAWTPGVAGQTRTITWKSAPVAPARAAIAALMAAMPEVVIVDEPPPPPKDIELRGSYKFLSDYGALIILVIIGALVYWHYH